MSVKQLRKVFQIKISLVGSKPPIWRRLQIPNSLSLDELHNVIQDAMGWFNCHLHQFEKDGVRYGIVDDDFGDELKDETGYRISELLKREKDALVYEYDFGDGWEHKVVLEKILPLDSVKNTVKCIAGKRACPPEDCGGIWGYRNLVEVISDSKHPEYDEIIEWVGDEFNPEYFDLSKTNEILSNAL